MTDGQQTYVPKIKPPQEYSAELIEQGIDIYGVGIGEEIDQVELQSLISKPEYIFLADRVNGLMDRLVSEIGQALTCEGLFLRSMLINPNRFYFLAFVFFLCSFLSFSDTYLRIGSVYIKRLRSQRKI